MAVVAALAFAPQAARAQTVDPQPAAFAALLGASSSPVAVAFDGRTPRVTAFSVPVTGATAAQRARNFLSTYAGLYDQTNAVDQALTVREVRTLAGLQVVSFGQSYRGVPVYGGQINVGLDPGDATGLPRALLATGALLPDLQLAGGLDTTPTVSPDACVAAVRTALARPGAPALAEPRLWVYDARILGGAADPHLVWTVTLGGGAPVQALCDAHDGAIVFQQPFALEGVGLAGFDLTDYDANNNNSDLSCYAFATRVDIGDESGLFQGFQTAENIAEWWHIRNTYLFFHDTFGRHSWDGKDLHVILNMHAGVDNAQYSTVCNQMEFRTGWASFDTTVHEATHGVIHFSSDLQYSYQPGALNESYADTMAVVADAADWTIGEDLSGGGGPIRDFKDPPSIGGKPDRWSQYTIKTNDKAGDWGGVHFFSSIINKAHYLEASGDAFNGFLAFPGMGRVKLGWLSYYAMQIVSQSASFADARATEIFAAQFLASKGLFGFTGADVCAVKNAFHAVEIGPSDYNCDGTDDNLQDADGDGRPDSADNCPTKFNPDQKDWDHDGVGDYCDFDFDNDGVPDGKDNCHDIKNWNQANNDGDAFGDACDPDDDNDGVVDGLDNCPFAANPSQFDGNNNGTGDACDPDYDGDGFYVESDNCTFVYNPTQTDSDGDDLGDACDLCPSVADWTHAYLNPFPPGSTPKPLQPDSDGDGTPDACDSTDFALATFTLNGSPVNQRTIFQPGAPAQSGSLDGPPGALIRFGIPVCIAGADPAPGQLVEFQFAMLPDSVDVAVLDDAGRRVATALPSGAGSELRGFRFRPDCTRAHSLQLILGPGFAGPVGFTAQSAIVAETESDPWASTPPSGIAPPPPIPDADADGVSDDVDICPSIGDPDQHDTDSDRVGDVCDNCTNVPNARVAPDAASFLAANSWATLTGGQRDDDHDGFGNACDAKFTPGSVVGAGDLVQFRASSGKLRASDTCGNGSRPCAIFDLDQGGTVIGAPDLARFRQLNGKLVGPKCAACPLPCQAGAQGDCGIVP